MTVSLLNAMTDEAHRQAQLPAALARVERAANRMNRLIEDLLDFANIEAGRLSLQPGPHDALALLRETTASLEALAHESGLSIALDVRQAESLPAVRCDRDRVLQVLSNLVGNAIKATPHGGSITLAAEQRGLEIVIVVSDSGPGIAPHELQHIFDRYWRSDRLGYKGSGLGLGIARGIVEAHGGRIWVESSVGSGTTVRFTLPVVTDSNQS
jgi:signal transduction histidine kinase